MNKNTPNPLLTLLSSRPETTVGLAGPVPSETPGRQAVAVATERRPAGAVEQPAGPDAGFVILAVMDPPGPDDRPGVITFAPWLTLAERRRVLANLEWSSGMERVGKRKV